MRRWDGSSRCGAGSRCCFRCGSSGTAAACGWPWSTASIPSCSEVTQVTLRRLMAAVVLAGSLPATAFAYEEAPVTDGGTLTGRLKFAGVPPKLEPLTVNKNRDVCGERKPSEAL